MRLPALRCALKHCTLQHLRAHLLLHWFVLPFSLGCLPLGLVTGSGLRTFRDACTAWDTTCPAHVPAAAPRCVLHHTAFTGSARHCCTPAAHCTACTTHACAHFCRTGYCSLFFAPTHSARVPFCLRFTLHATLHTALSTPLPPSPGGCRWLRTRLFGSAGSVHAGCIRLRYLVRAYRFHTPH